MSLNISLSPELENQVRHHVESCVRGCASEMIPEALRLFEAHQNVRKVNWAALKSNIALGVADISAGRIREIDIETPDVEIRLDLTLHEALAELRTWSSTQRCIMETGVDPCMAPGDRMKEVWPVPEGPKTIIRPITLRCGRVE